ncbi:hypothetical protein [Acidisoma sp. 7E03]
MKSMFVVGALTIGMASAALAGQTASASSQGVVMPNQRASYLAHYTLAQNDVVMPNQRASYLKHYDLA